jgi:hypothetical protein
MPRPAHTVERWACSGPLSQDVTCHKPGRKAFSVTLTNRPMQTEQNGVLLAHHMHIVYVGSVEWHLSSGRASACS